MLLIIKVHYRAPWSNHTISLEVHLWLSGRWRLVLIYKSSIITVI